MALAQQGRARGQCRAPAAPPRQRARGARPRRGRVQAHAAAGSGDAPSVLGEAATALLQRLAAGGDAGVAADSAAAAPRAAGAALQPHFGARAAGELLDAARAAAGGVAPPALPQLPALPHVDLPAAPQLPALPRVELPAAPQLPALPRVELPGSLAEGEALLAGAAAAAGDAFGGLAALPGEAQQRLALAAAQLQALAEGAAGAGLASGAEPHWGTRAAAAWLQELAAALGAALQGAAAALSLQLPAAAAALGAALAAAAGGLQAQADAAGAGAAGLQAQLVALAAAAAALPESGAGGYDFATLAALAAAVLAAVAASVPAEGALPTGDARDGLSHEYDPDAVAAYFAARPVQVAARAAQLAAEVAGFGAALAADAATGRLQVRRGAEGRGRDAAAGGAAAGSAAPRCADPRRPPAPAGQRARARGAAARRHRAARPAYVKVAQALSTRVDLLSPEYYRQVQLLQDRVPPFPCDQAREAMAAAFGRPVNEVFATLSPAPVAAASLGQVYKGVLRGSGAEVAVKVQRPGVLEAVCLDLLLMRRVAAALSALPEVNTDWAALIDNWAVRFLHEMDYTREQANGSLFAAQMAAAGVTGVVTADVVPDLSNDVVLTTEWVDGEKLSESRASDVRELCSTLLSAYLIQLLDTGLLHADPHPGNLIRTRDGKICVLDFGLMTEVTPEQRIALVEYIAHLSTQDWDNVARDLQTLGFIPADAGDPVALGMAEPLGRILVQLSGGGGAAKVNIDAVMGEVEALGSKYPISIPPFFALILRAFSVIEGIALAVDPDYSIVQECLPYLARRLLSDDNPRVRQALRDVLYGGRARLDVDRLIRLSDAFSSYTTDGLAGDGAAAAGAPAPAAAGAALAPARAAAAGAGGASEPLLSPAARDALLVVFSRRGSYVQELLVEELVAAADALSREALSGTLRAVLGSAPVAVALSSVEALGPLRPVLLPLTTPLELLSRLAPAVALTPEDEEALGVVRSVFALLQRAQAAAAAPGAYRAVGAADAGNAAAGMVFSTTAAPPPGGGPSGAALDARAAVAAAADAAASAAGAAAELRPLLPELLPGLAHTGELFLRAFTGRVAARLVKSLSLADAAVEAERERELAMAALGFLSGAAPPAAARGGAVLPAAGVFSTVAAAAAAPPAPPGALGFGGAGGLGAPLGGGLSAGQVITGLAAAPLLAGLALLSELQRRQRRSYVSAPAAASSGTMAAPACRHDWHQTVTRHADALSTGVGVLGAGAYGTALAIHCTRAGHATRLWARSAEVADEINSRRTNSRRLPGQPCPPGLTASTDLAAVVAASQLVLLVVPASHIASTVRACVPHLQPDAALVCCAKGITPDSLQTMDEVLDSCVPPAQRRQLAFLSGPSFAAEVAEGKPTGLTIAARDEGVARRVQHWLSAGNLRCYRTTDVVGLELGGALKNVIAIGCGMCDGKGYGANGRAMIITRGLHEMTRLAAAKGAHPLTLSGLGGIGDLVLTCARRRAGAGGALALRAARCAADAAALPLAPPLARRCTGEASRNRTLGYRLGCGEAMEAVVESMHGAVAEGVPTARAAKLLADKLGVRCPIIQGLYRILFEGADIDETVTHLLCLPLTAELDAAQLSFEPAEDGAPVGPEDEAARRQPALAGAP
ncbi:aarF domain-containing protein kinase [Scenedesmus sp. PABB004]|nr:aarF domain-containing protein kinase [Scenedesmus sp. PABB004]